MYNINEMIEFYKKIDKKTLLLINTAFMYNTWIFTYPEWFSNLRAILLARKVNKQYAKIQAELSRLERLKNNK